MPVTERKHSLEEDPKVFGIHSPEEGSSIVSSEVSVSDSARDDVEMNMMRDNASTLDAIDTEDDLHLSTDRQAKGEHGITVVGEGAVEDQTMSRQDRIDLMKARKLQTPPRLAPFKMKFDHFGLGYTSDKTKHSKLYNSYLRPNARFVGEQQSGKAKYHIQVEFKTVDLVNSLVTGFLQISGLTESHPEITTCFKGEIINNPLNHRKLSDSSQQHPTQLEPKTYSFATENSSWGSYLKNDLDHWKKLTCSGNLSESQLKQKLQRIQNGDEDTNLIYMRWKEEFLLPDSRVKQINGASFEGFYYIVINISSQQDGVNDCYSSNATPGSISGLYYHKTSEKFQSLSLRYVDERKAVGDFEFV